MFSKTGYLSQKNLPLTGRYLVVIVSYPPTTGKVRIITAREMIQKEKAKYRKMKGGRK